MKAPSIINFKQLEAFYWIVKLGSFELAANRLNISQSAMSKRIKELEDNFDINLFDRSKRISKLTSKGREIFMYVEEILEKREMLFDRFIDENVILKKIRIGVTELTAFTWLPNFIEEIRKKHPNIVIEPTIDLSPILFKKLEEEVLDIIVVPDIFNAVWCDVITLSTVENCWMGASSLISGKKIETLEDIFKFPVILQGKDSGTGIIYERWLKSNNIVTNDVLISQNLLVQLGLSVSGLGISYLPKECMGHLVKSGVLDIIDINVKLPKVKYSALVNSRSDIDIIDEVLNIAISTCDFSNSLLTPKLY